MRKLFIKAITMALALILILSTASLAFAQDSKSATINEQFNPNKMKTISGKEFEITALDFMFADYKNGYMFPFFSPMEKLDVIDSLQVGKDDSAIYIMYLPEKYHKEYLALLDKKEADEAGMAEINSYLDLSTDVIAVFSIKTDDENTLAQFKDNYQTVEKLAQNGELVYYIAYNTTCTLKDASEADRKAFEIIANGVNEIKEDMTVFPPVNEEEVNKNIATSAQSAVQLQDLNELDLQGNPFTFADIAKYDLTIINVWGTSCGPCVEEMGEIQALKDKLPQNMNLITICLDAKEDIDLAKKIVSSVNSTFTTLQTDDQTARKMFPGLAYTPTTFFVNKNGEALGEALVGVPQEGGKVSDAYLKTALERIGNVK